MDRTERFYLIDRMLQEQAIVPVEKFLDALEISLATFKRDLEYMRSRLNAPIIWNRSQGGYQFEKAAQDGPRYELPGLWLNAQEMQALLTMRHLLSELGPNVLERHLRPLIGRLESALHAKGIWPQDAVRRIRLWAVAKRSPDPECFETVSKALLERQQLHIRYFTRYRGESSERTISPQRLVLFRNNWYLAAWCHLKNDLRIFSLDAIEQADMANKQAIDVADEDLDKEFEGSYGIFPGHPANTARLRFSALMARWIAKETWHPDQKGWFDDSGAFIMEIPYSHDQELLMDIMKYGAEVEVVSPESLRRKTKDHLAAALSNYLGH